MLQQTTVQTVLRRYPAFLRRFPTVRSLARASEDSVLAAWSGLGYYGRARNLRLAAKEIVSSHGGAPPGGRRRASETARIRPLHRGGRRRDRLRPSEPPDGREHPASRLAALRDGGSHGVPSRIVGRYRPGDTIAALFDLGQGICRPRNPRCSDCPLARDCRARREGSVESFPEKKPLPPYRPVYLCAAAIARGGKLWLRRRNSTWLAGLWEFPSVEAASRRSARAAFRRLYGDATLLGEVEHTVVRRKVRAELYGTDRAPRDAEGRWMTLREVGRRASPTLTRKIAGLLSRRGFRA